MSETPDGLGQWKGGLRKGEPNWIAQKSHPTQFNSRKNDPRSKKEKEKTNG